MMEPADCRLPTCPGSACNVIGHSRPPMAEYRTAPLSAATRASTLMYAQLSPNRTLELFLSSGEQRPHRKHLFVDSPQPDQER